MAKPKIIVLGGGISDEREVSLRSSRSVYEGLFKAGYNAEFIDPGESQEYIQTEKQNIVLPILHGTFGEDGQVQKLLEKNKIPYLGSDSKASKNSFDKWLARRILVSKLIPMPKADYISLKDYKGHYLAKKPHVLKTVDGGSSLGTHIIRDISRKINAEEAFAGRKMIIEELITGIEITVPILDGVALPVVEIHPPPKGEFDYENKYNGKSQELCPPTLVSSTEQEYAQTLAKHVNSVMNCRHLSRVDIMIDQSGSMHVLEINTMPGLTEQSLFPLSAEYAGMKMSELSERFIELVARDYSLDITS